MERRDILVIVGALIVVLILAVVVKPMLTGKEVDLGIPQTESLPTPDIPAPVPDQPEPTEIDTPPRDSATPSPESEPLVTGEPVTGSEPSAPVPSPTPLSWQPDPDNPMPAIQMVQYADIVGRYTGSTSPFRIPTPYWELSYNITPSGTHPVFLMDVIEKGGAAEDEEAIRSIVYREGKAVDPKEGRFFEGGRDYYLKITAENLEKYQVIISIPLKYIPDV